MLSRTESADESAISPLVVGTARPALGDQADKEDRARLIAHFAGIDQWPADAPLGVMRRQFACKPVRVRPGDPLGQLWELPARQARGAR